MCQWPTRTSVCADHLDNFDLMNRPKTLCFLAAAIAREGAKMSQKWSEMGCPAQFWLICRASPHFSRSQHALSIPGQFYSDPFFGQVDELKFSAWRVQLIAKVGGKMGQNGLPKFLLVDIKIWHYQPLLQWGVQIGCICGVFTTSLMYWPVNIQEVIEDGGWMVPHPFRRAVSPKLLSVTSAPHVQGGPWKGFALGLNFFDFAFFG